MIMESETSSILLNGVPDNVFYYRRGIRQLTYCKALLI
jgi:hypothetical protein